MKTISHYQSNSLLLKFQFNLIIIHKLFSQTTLIIKNKIISKIFNIQTLIILIILTTFNIKILIKINIRIKTFRIKILISICIKIKLQWLILLLRSLINEKINENIKKKNLFVINFL